MEGLINKIQLVWRAHPEDLPDVLYPFKRSEMMMQKLYLEKVDFKINSKKKVIMTESKIHVVSSHCASMSVQIIGMFAVKKDALKKNYSAKVE